MDKLKRNIFSTIVSVSQQKGSLVHLDAYVSRNRSLPNPFEPQFSCTLNGDNNNNHRVVLRNQLKI